MTQIFGSPGRYIQGYDELRNVKNHIEWIGDSFLVIGTKRRIASFGEIIEKSCGENYRVSFSEFGGHCTKKAVTELTKTAKKEKCKGIIGMGGGSVIDAAKAVAANLDIATIIIPTIASTDAPTTALSVIYNEDGSLDAEVQYPRSPEVILVDTKIISEAPVRFLVAGMGDALSTYFGARVAYVGYKDNEFGGKSTETSMMIAKLAYDLIMEHGYAAKIACEQKVSTKDLDKVIEANVLLSGLGCESNTGASDHSFYYGLCCLTNREEKMYHGEYVAFSTLCLMVLEGAPKTELEKMYKFCLEVGLPVCLEDLELDDLTDEEYKIVAEGVLSQKNTHNHPFPVSQIEVIGAIKTADGLGKMYRAKMK